MIERSAATGQISRSTERISGLKSDLALVFSVPKISALEVF